MRRLVSLSLAFMLAALALVACNSRDGSGSSSSRTASTNAVPSAPATPNDGVRRITTAELHDALERGTAVVVDVRSPETYQTSHIKGAINIPEAQIVTRKAELPADKLIVTYCS